MTKPYIVSVDFNFEGQKNKYLEAMIQNGGYRQGPDAEKAAHKPYDFKCTFGGVEVGDILIVKCATGIQAVKAVSVSYPDTIPAHATARIVAKLDLEGIAQHEAQAVAYENLLLDIDAEARKVIERKHYKKLAKQSPVLAELIALKDSFEDGR